MTLRLLGVTVFRASLPVVFQGTAEGFVYSFS